MVWIIKQALCRDILAFLQQGQVFPMARKPADPVWYAEVNTLNYWISLAQEQGE